LEDLIEYDSESSKAKQIPSDISDSALFSDSPVVDVVLPVYNEVATIRRVILDFYKEIAVKMPVRLIVAEDGSDDGTRDVLLSLRNEIPISLFCDPRRKGFSKGVSDAFRRCRAQWVLFSDSDGQYFPSDFWRLWENRNGYDMIIGRKLIRNDGVHRKVLASGFHALTNALFDLKLHDADCGFRLVRKEVIDSVLDEVKCLKYSFNAEFAIRAALKGFKILEVPINHAYRARGETQIYKPSKIPFIVIKQLQGLAELYAEARNKQ
jgi:glycosyltransferase involved in cell wall biosynthesis